MKNLLYDWGGFNVVLFHALNGNHTAWLDQVMLAFTWAGGHERFAIYMAIASAAGWLAISRRTGGDGVATGWLLVLTTYAVAYALDGLLVTALKHAFDLPRPALALPPGSVVTVGPRELHYSFPSGHASFAMLTGTAFWSIAQNRVARAFIVIYVLGVCLSRSHLGAHFPAEVVYGAAKSLLLVLLLRQTLVAFSRHDGRRALLTCAGCRAFACPPAVQSWRVARIIATPAPKTRHDVVHSPVVHRSHDGLVRPALSLFFSTAFA